MRVRGVKLRIRFLLLSPLLLLKGFRGGRRVCASFFFFFGEVDVDVELKLEEEEKKLLDLSLSVNAFVMICYYHTHLCVPALYDINRRRYIYFGVNLFSIHNMIFFVHINNVLKSFSEKLIEKRSEHIDHVHSRE